MKKIITLLVAMLMLFSIIAGAVVAEEVADGSTDVVEELTEDTTADVVPTETTETVVDGSEVEAAVEDGLNGDLSDGDVEAGITPDSPLWGIERAIEGIDLALTFDNSKKVQKRLMIAKERMLEVKTMAEEGNLESAADAAEAHAENMAAAEEDLAAAVEEEGETEELQALENKFDQHIQVLERVQAKLQEKGVNAPGIANALAIAKAKQNVKQARVAVKEARKTGGDLEGAKVALGEAKTQSKEEMAQVRENKKFVKKSGEVAEEGETEQNQEQNAVEELVAEETPSEEPTA